MINHILMLYRVPVIRYSIKYSAEYRQRNLDYSCVIRTKQREKVQKMATSNNEKIIYIYYNMKLSIAHTPRRQLNPSPAPIVKRRGSTREL